MDEVFGRYRLLSVIGQGGMGTVYRAHDTVIDRDVAVKVLPAQLATEPGYAQRFRREAHTAAKLTEPHIIPIHDTGEIDGRLYLVMPIVKGVDVHELLHRHGPMTPQRAVHIIEQLAAALDAAHATGLVHRDIKPSNALVTERDFVYLIDFGIAHDASATKLTSTGMIVGTLAYMAPERFTAGAADARSDVYALTCVLHECLTGVQPFPGDSMEQQIAGHLTLDPPRPSHLRPHIPAGFDAVIARGMAKNAQQRYQSAHELATAARHALTTTNHRDAPTLAATTQRLPDPPPAPQLRPSDRPFPPQVPLPSPSRSQPRPGLIVAAVGAVAVIVVAAIVVFRLLQPHPSTPQTPTAQPAPPSGPASAVSEPTAQTQTASTPYLKLPGIAACEVAANNVVCEGNWPQAPTTSCAQCPQPMHMDQAIVDANGTLTWRDANIGQPDAAGGLGWYTLKIGAPYHGFGWTAQLVDSTQATFTNDATRHGMKITWIALADASHGEVGTF
jgi:serine/threonine protein kinase